jgi:hypothetical protein
MVSDDRMNMRKRMRRGHVSAGVDGWACQHVGEPAHVCVGIESA